MSTATIATILLLGVFLVLVFLRVPVVYAIGVASLLDFFYLGINPMQMALKFVSNLNSYTLLAVPFFILMGELMSAGGITDTVRFRKFLVGCASLVSEQVNYSTLAESADIAPSTAKEWLKILVGLNIIYLLAPYSNNELKRLSKTPKLYFCDTGLCAYLSMWLTPATLMQGAASGHFYENYVVMELVKNYSYGKL